MTANDAVHMMASARLDPDEAERADIRWALQMEAMHAWTGARTSLRAQWWLTHLPWRPEYLTAEQRAVLEAKRERMMAEFERARRARKAEKTAKVADVGQALPHG